ncbi:hypothetical protein PsYK624_034090 [Phanerochaete sordida]|uniref:Uncharacterized protein n=1 Tax=Phanerochaete sordida TaxID=48140 RepID=A0A9P3L9J1_9APHY|nr:hypothetical protein PsYK624_034090 [Phanerochaete sordida]
MYEQQKTFVPAKEPAVPPKCAVVHFRGASMVVAKTWLQKTTYNTAMDAFKAHFGRVPQNADVLNESCYVTPSAKYQIWKGLVYLKVQLGSQPASGNQAAVVHDFSATGAGWSDIVADIDRAYLVIM